tara:strand:+ start:304 stop:813 length:510 start_codon:yes stop_codon:yes gene_type:complete
MDQSLENKINLKTRIIDFYNFNKIKIFFLVIILIISLISLLFIKQNETKKNILIAEKYVEAGVYLASNNPENATKLYEEIILSKNKFYSILALNKVIEKTLISDKNIILEYFNILENSISKGDQKDLIIFKKALFLIKNSENQEGKNLLEKLISKNSIFKTVSQELLGK